uniref:Fibrinogen C-terminal domain-containing protein n=1 Tax=Oryzias latipes TaxID=8090 RepID=H2MAJ3_ORYLA
PPHIRSPESAYCEMGTNGIWTVIQKRTGGAVAFDREWAAYKNGFGFVSCIYNVSNSNLIGCCIKKTCFLSKGDAIQGAYHGIDQNGFGFSTFDRDNDGCDPCIFFCDIAARSCTDFDQGGWRYSKCGSASLNGEWHPKGANTGWLSGLHWLTWKRPVSYSARATRMMFTPM